MSGSKTRDNYGIFSAFWSERRVPRVLGAEDWAKGGEELGRGYLGRKMVKNHQTLMEIHPDGQGLATPWGLHDVYTRNFGVWVQTRCFQGKNFSIFVEIGSNLWINWCYSSC